MASPGQVFDIAVTPGAAPPTLLDVSATTNPFPPGGGGVRTHVEAEPTSFSSAGPPAPNPPSLAG